MGDSRIDYTFDLSEFVLRVLKYLFEGIVVSLAAFIVPGKALDVQEVLMLGFVAASCFAILDLFAPSIGVSMRQGAGFGMGARLVGFPGAGPQSVV